MGNYATVAILRERLSSDEVEMLVRGLTGSAETDYLNRVINWAEGRVNTYASKLYTVPLPAGFMVSPH